MIADLFIVSAFAYAFVLLLVACDWIVGRWLDD